MPTVQVVSVPAATAAAQTIEETYTLLTGDFANVAAYEAIWNHTLSNSAAGFGDVSTSADVLWYATVGGEGGANFLAGLNIRGIRATYTVDRLLAV